MAVATQFKKEHPTDKKEEDLRIMVAAQESILQNFPLNERNKMKLTITELGKLHDAVSFWSLGFDHPFKDKRAAPIFAEKIASSMAMDIVCKSEGVKAFSDLSKEGQERASELSMKLKEELQRQAKA